MRDKSGSTLYTHCLAAKGHRGGGAARGPLRVRRQPRSHAPRCADWASVAGRGRGCALVQLGVWGGYAVREAGIIQSALIADERKGAVSVQGGDAAEGEAPKLRPRMAACASRERVHTHAMTGASTNRGRRGR